MIRLSSTVLLNSSYVVDHDRTSISVVLFRASITGSIRGCCWCTVRSHHTQKTPDSKGCEQLVHLLQSFKLDLENGMRNSANSSARDSSLGRGKCRRPAVVLVWPLPHFIALQDTCIVPGVYTGVLVVSTFYRNFMAPKGRVVLHVPHEDSRNR